ncbi:hypothetical protein ABPG74_007873 [Tetrahymena malaccensis]
MADKKKGLSFNMNLTQENMKKTESDVDILILQRFKELVQQSNCFDEYISHDKKIFKIMQKNVDFKLEDFETISELGRGASGRVFKVKHKETGKFYAKKEIRINDDEMFQKQLIWEIKTLFSCNSPHIVQYYCAFYTECMLHLILEYMDMGTLDTILKKTKQVSEPILIYTTYQIIKGIHYLHKDLKIIHRDLKPGNILVNSEGEIKISDLGICGKVNGTMDQKNTFVGTTIYMSPERLNGDSYTMKTDIWSLGLLLIEFSEGKHPIQASNNFFEVLNNIIDFKIPPLKNINSPEFTNFIEICLKSDQNERADITQLLEHPFLRKIKGKTAQLKPFFVNWMKVVEK